MKKTLLCLIMVLSLICFKVNAQVEHKVRGGLTVDMLIPAKGMGFGGNLDFRYNIFHNWNAGINIGVGVMAKDVEFDNNIDQRGKASTVTNILAVSDYYFNWGRSIFAPFVGGSLGVYFLSNVAIDNHTNAAAVRDIKSSAKFGGSVRVGAEIWRVRVGAAYNFIGRSDVQDIYGNKVGIVKNAYFNIFLGFYIGGGNWKQY